MTIPLEQPPMDTPENLKEWLNRNLIQIAGQFEEYEYQIAQLEARIKILESKTP